MKQIFFYFFLVIVTALQVQAQLTVMNTQVLVVAGSTGGTAAGIQAARSGAQTVIVEQTNMLGGMLTAAAVSCTDGNDGLKSGIWQQFRQALYLHYGSSNLASGWVSNTCFEPHVGDSIFKAWAANEKKLKVLYNWYFDKSIVKANKITGAEFINVKGERLIVHAAIVIDATELGDAFASAGALYDVGMETTKYSGEIAAPGKNDIIQDLTWTAVLKDYGKGADKTIAMPKDYTAAKYYCSTSDAPCNDKPYKLNTQTVLDYGKLTTTDTLQHKYMLNWPIHGNDYYLNVISLKPMQREAAYVSAKNKTLGFIYFLQTELGYKNIGFAEDEVSSGMALIPYHREGRRVRGLIRLNINYIKNPYQYNLYKTGIAVGDYPVDHHHGQYPGKAPQIVFPQVPSFNIPVGALIPEKIDHLIVCEKGISVSNIANGATRLQPVILLTGQAAGVIAAQCIAKQLSPRNIQVREVQEELLKLKCYLLPFCDVDPHDPAWEATQKAGAIGLIAGVGKSIDWENKTFFYPDSTLKNADVQKNLQQYFSRKISVTAKDEWLTIGGAKNLIDAYFRHSADNQVSAKPYSKKDSHYAMDATFWKDTLHLDNFDTARPITRKELSVFFFYYAKPFVDFGIDIYGNNSK